MSKVIIIGGGFSGLTAATNLARSGLGLEITLIDKKCTLDFLPLLPDSLGRGIRPECLAYNIEAITKKLSTHFIPEEVIEVNLDKREVATQKQSLNYDYLVIASGSETNFYGNSTFQESAYKLDSARDAEIIIGLLKENRFDNFIVSGGGYTGIEVATNLSLFFKKRKLKNKIIILERAPDILGPLPVWMKDYVKSNLGRMGIEILLNTTIEKIERIKVFLSGGKVFERAIVIWAAGVKTAAFIQNLDREKNPQGRLKVDDYLRLDEHCFVAGDTAYFTAKNVFLRMAVQFAIMEGVCVAENIKRSIKGKPLRKYQPQDAGYIIPMANNLSCGIVLGIKIKGVLATWLHFMMCIYRSYGIKNKLGIIKDLIHPIM